MPLMMTDLMLIRKAKLSEFMARKRRENKNQTQKELLSLTSYINLTNTS